MRYIQRILKSFITILTLREKKVRSNETDNPLLEEGERIVTPLERVLTKIKEVVDSVIASMETA